MLKEFKQPFQVDASSVFRILQIIHGDLIKIPLLIKYLSEQNDCFSEEQPHQERVEI